MTTTPSSHPASNPQDTANRIQLLALGLRRHLARSHDGDEHESLKHGEGTFGVDAGDQTVISADTPILGV